MRRRYGDTPLHLLAQLVAFALAGYAASRALADGGPWLALGIWFVGAAIGHDLVLWPLYALTDTVAQLRARRRTRPLPAPRGVPWINHVRVPVGLSLLLLLVWWPLVLDDAPGTFTAATGLTTAVYLGRWLGVSGAFLVASALVYAVRLGLASSGLTSGGASARSAPRG